jgi:hypothetical protein
VSRRGFVKTVVLSGAVLAAGSVGVVSFITITDPKTGEARAYELSHGEDLNLWVTNGERFAILVRRGTDVIEEHANVTMDGITELDSDYFTARYIEAPAPVL